MEICYFDGECQALYITEFGHSKTKNEKNVNVRVREEYLLHIVVNGVCRFSEFDVPQGKALLISKGIRHHFSVDKGYEHYWFGFGGEMVNELLKSHGLDTERHLLLPINCFNYISALLALSLENCLAEKNEQIALSALKTCLQMLGRREKQTCKPADALRAKRFIENNYHRAVSMDDVANYISISEKHLCRIFVRQFGISPQKYLVDYRMEKARELILSTDLRIKEVASSVGYTSQLNFSAMYKKYFGHSPSYERRSDR